MVDNFVDLSDKELTIGYWLTKYRVQIKAGFVMFLVVVIGFFTLNSGRKFYDYFIQSASYEKMLAELAKDRINFAQLRRLNGPKKMQIKFTKALPGQSSDFYDIVSEVENINQDWWIEKLNYQFSIDGQLTDWQTTYLLPGEKKYLYYFNYKNNRAPGSLRLIIGREGWVKVKDSSLLDNRKRFKKADIKVADEKFIPGIDGVKNSEVKFSLTNNSLNGLWEVDVFILLKQGNSLAAFNIVKVDKLAAGETRQVAVNMGNIKNLGLHPEVLVSANIIDPSNIMDSSFEIPVSNIR